MSDHIHDCTGPDHRCPCGYQLVIPPICVGVDVWDANRPDGERSVVNEGFNCDSLDTVIHALREIANRLEAMS